MKKAALALAVCLIFCAGARAAAVDMNTQTCQDWLDATEEEQDQMVAWLRGFIAGRSTSSLYNLATARSDAALLKGFCQGHLTVGLVSAASQWKH